MDKDKKQGMRSQGRESDESLRIEAEFAASGRILKDRISNIKSRWEEKVREDVPESSGMASPVLVNSLERFLKELANTLKNDGPSKQFSPGEGMTGGHAQQRANYSGYFLTQLLTEYSALREVISRELQEQGALTFEVHRFIDKAIDSVIATAATEFAKVQDAQVQNALHLAQLSNRDLEQFAAVTAHDLKSPLATVLSYLDLLSTDFSTSLNSEMKGYIETMSATLSRMKKLVDRMLEYAKLAGTERKLVPVDLNIAVESAVQNLTEQIKNEDAKVEYDQLPTVNGDGDLLVQLFQNMIANSIKFRSDKTPRVLISAEDNGDRWMIHLKDNGVGFDSKEKEKIFTIYSQLDSQRREQGVGIGLATSRRIVEHHGGSIDVSSSPGAGASFDFSLPKPGIATDERH